MARITKFSALANLALTRASNWHSAQRRCMSQIAAMRELEHADHEIEDIGGESLQYKKQSDEKEVIEMNWVPHPRSGIYFPQGHDWVMEDVPCDSATLGQGQTYWLRNIDGVDKRDPDISSADHYFLTSHHA
ncbi:hypothetical protein vseg_016108 [Gypsophila vaccaria]